MMIRTVAVVLLFFTTFSLMVSVQSVAVDRVASSGSGWLSGWTYRKAHNITGSTAGEQFNYPIRLNVHYNNGADNNGEVYLAEKCGLDFGDIRFTDSTGASPLDYWIQQKTDGSLALFWVKVSRVKRVCLAACGSIVMAVVAHDSHS
jgi:hypothetical protein